VKVRKSAVESTTLTQPFCVNQAVGLRDLPQRLHAQFVAVRQFFSLVGSTKLQSNVSKTLMVKNQTVIDCLQLLDTETCDDENDVISEKLVHCIFILWVNTQNLTC